MWYTTLTVRTWAFPTALPATGDPLGPVKVFCLPHIFQIYTKPPVTVNQVLA